MASDSDNHSMQRILIVEDEENARKGYEALLRKWNYDVLGVGRAKTPSPDFPNLRRM